MANLPYNITDFAFTLDDDFIEFSTNTENTYFDLKVSIFYYDFFSSDVQEKILEHKIPLFNKKQIYNVGRKIHRQLANPLPYRNAFGFQYKPARVFFEIKEINITTGAEVSSQTVNNVKFIAGKKPTVVENNNAILTTNNAFERVTKNGFFIVTFLLSPGDHVLKILKNNVAVATENVTATTTINIYSIKVDVALHNGTKGDVFEVVLVDSILKKSIVVFPDNLHSKQLVFIDSFKLLRSLECTGHFSFINEYDQITHKYKRNLVEILEIVTTEKVNKLIINTGWLLKTDTETIDALLDSKKVYLTTTNTTVLEMVPISKKMTGENSDEELYAYDLEFQINKTNA